MRLVMISAVLAACSGGGGSTSGSSGAGGAERVSHTQGMQDADASADAGVSGWDCSCMMRHKSDGPNAWTPPLEVLSTAGSPPQSCSSTPLTGRAMDDCLRDAKNAGQTDIICKCDCKPIPCGGGGAAGTSGGTGGA